MIVLGMRSCCTPYSIPPPLKVEVVAQSSGVITAVTVHGPVHRSRVSFTWIRSLCNAESALAGVISANGDAAGLCGLPALDEGLRSCPQLCYAILLFARHRGLVR